MLRILSGAAAALLAGAVAASFWVSRPAFEERLEPAVLEGVELAPPSEALSFARAVVEGREQTLLVRSWQGGRVQAVVAGDGDPIALLAAQGFEALQALADAGPRIDLNAAALGVPFAAREQNVAVGLNYREHAQESQLEEEPFLFPKFARPTPWTSDVAKAGSARLDYEVELGLVALRDLRPGDAPAFGLVLANELTDRWALVRNFDGDEPMGVTGFADGKSREGFAPLGALLVVPRDFEAFWPRLVLELWVNGRLRQRESARQMVWPPSRILAETFARASQPYRYGQATVSLLPAGRLEAGTVILSGTPAGVIFRPLNVLNPWVYLQPGDEVVLRAGPLGPIRNRIAP